MRIAFTASAVREAEEAANWYWERSGDRVRNVLRHQPGLGTPGVRGTRKLSLDRFPYTLVYRIDGDIVRVLAFMHQSRRPDYWRHRR